MIWCVRNAEIPESEVDKDPVSSWVLLTKHYHCTWRSKNGHWAPEEAHSKSSCKKSQTNLWLSFQGTSQTMAWPDTTTLHFLFTFRFHLSAPKLQTGKFRAAFCLVAALSPAGAAQCCPSDRTVNSVSTRFLKADAQLQNLLVCHIWRCHLLCCCLSVTQSLRSSLQDLLSAKTKWGWWWEGGNSDLLFILPW